MELSQKKRRAGMESWGERMRRGILSGRVRQVVMVVEVKESDKMNRGV